MKKSRLIYEKADKLVDESGVFSYVSKPVITKEGDWYYLSAFVTAYEDEDFQTGFVSRPTKVIKLDFKKGDFIEVYDTQFCEFSSAKYDKKYQLIRPDRYGEVHFFYSLGMEQKQSEEIFALLDKVRLEFLQTGNINWDCYWEYMRCITTYLARDYKQFYKELSIKQ
jgi:hypothetical protein